MPEEKDENVERDLQDDEGSSETSHGFEQREKKHEASDEQSQIAEEHEEDDNEAIRERLSSIEHHLLRLESMFEEKIADDEVKADLFEKLHKQLAEYRDDFLFKYVIKRLFKDLIALFDRIENTIEYAEKGDLSAEDMLRSLHDCKEQLIKLMEKQRLYLIEETTEKFDERYQEAFDQKPVENPEDDGKVLNVVRRGFLTDLKVLVDRDKYETMIFRPVQVIVGKYQQEENVDG